jgi:LL-H family phage holin
MNNTLNTIAGAAGWLLFLLTLVASYFEYAKKNDPEVAEKMKHVGTFAEWAVSLQDTLDKPNPDKLASATNEVLKQADKTGIKLTPEMAQGAVEKAVTDRKKSADKPVVPAEPVAPAQSAAIDDAVHDLLDDLEAK